MKHYVLGLVFNSLGNKVLLVKKKRPGWMKNYWNGIGGKIEKDETPLQAMKRETFEETQLIKLNYKHTITFVCPGGTVYVFIGRTTDSMVRYKQIEDEELKVFYIYDLPKKLIANLKWIIPLSTSSAQFPIMIQQNLLGIF